MTDAIDNAIDDMLLARAAGTGPVLDREHLYPPDKWGTFPEPSTVGIMLPVMIHANPHAAQPGNMPTVGDIVAERDALRKWASYALKLLEDIRHGPCDSTHYHPQIAAGTVAFLVSTLPQEGGPVYMGAHVDTLNRMHAAEARVTVLESERDMLAGLLKALMSSPAIHTSDVYCWHCGETVWRTNMGRKLPADPHAADCPWRLAKEYLERAEP